MAPPQTAPASGAVAALPGGRAGGGIPPEYEGYVRALRQRIQERLVYPQVAVRRRLEGAVELELELDATGRLVNVGAVDRGGAAMLREAAVRAVRDATPFPFPAHLVPRALLIRLPVVFELR
jgi:protein TonB